MTEMTTNKLVRLVEKMKDEMSKGSSEFYSMQDPVTGKYVLRHRNYPEEDMGVYTEKETAEVGVAILNNVLTVGKAAMIPVVGVLCAMVSMDQEALEHSKQVLSACSAFAPEACKDALAEVKMAIESADRVITLITTTGIGLK